MLQNANGKLMTLLQTEPSNSNGLQYTQTSDDVHIFRLTEFNQSTIDAWFKMIVPIYEEMSPYGTLRMCIDLRIAELSHLTYGFSKWRLFMQENPNITFHSRYAILHEPNLSFITFKAMIRVMPDKMNNATIEYFTHDRYEAAMAWLLANEL